MALQDDFNDAADDWFALTPDVFPAVPRPAGDGLVGVRAPVELPILDTPGFRERPDAVKAALLILSQSPTARKFAAIAIHEGYRINVDPPAISGAGAAFEAATFGSTDHANKRINLRGCDDPLRMAFILAHELTHVSQIVEGGLDMRVSTLHPLAAIRQLLAMEADARAHEFLFAVELSQCAAGDPGERLLFPQALDAAAESMGIAFGPRLIELAKPELAAGGAPQNWMKRVFKSFYATPGLRMHYENTILHGIETFEKENPGALKDPALFQGDMPPADLVARLGRHNLAYLANSEDFINFGDVRISGVSAGTQQQLAALEAIRHENPQTQGDASWRGAVYQLMLASTPKPRPPAP